MTALRLEVHDRLSRLTLTGSRPALGLSVFREIATQLHAANANPQIGAILIESDGSLFAGGWDWAEARHWAEADWNTVVEVLTSGRWLRKPLVAGVRGPVLSAAVLLLANAHLVVAAQGTSFALLDIRQGAWPAAGFEALVRAIGVRRATELALTGRQFSAPEALQFGLVHELVPPFEIEDRASSVAVHVAQANPSAVDFGLRQASLGEMSLPHFRRFLDGGDLDEALRAAAEQRAPHWPSAQPRNG
jgi:enoyl-CoA hydratase/carnithine racemase